VVHGAPVAGGFLGKVAVTQGRLLQAGAKRIRCVRRGVVLHRPVDESASLAGFGGTRDRLRGLIFENEVNALSHGCGLVGLVTFTGNTMCNRYICQAHCVCTILVHFGPKTDSSAERRQFDRSQAARFR